MATRKWPITLVALAAAVPAAAMQDVRPATAPAGSADIRYCMRIEAATGSRVEKVRCWTRERWTSQGVDVDREWPEEGVRIIG